MTDLLDRIIGSTKGLRINSSFDGNADYISISYYPSLKEVLIMGWWNKEAAKANCEIVNKSAAEGAISFLIDVSDLTYKV